MSSNAGSRSKGLHLKRHPEGIFYHPQDVERSIRAGSSFLNMQEHLGSAKSEGSCHCDGNHSEVKSDGGWSGFLTDHSVELGSLFHEGGSVIWRTKVGRRLVPSAGRS